MGAVDGHGSYGEHGHGTTQGVGLIVFGAVGKILQFFEQGAVPRSPAQRKVSSVGLTGGRHSPGLLGARLRTGDDVVALKAICQVADLGTPSLAGILRKADRNAAAVSSSSVSDGLLDLVGTAAQADNVQDNEATGVRASELETNRVIRIATFDLRRCSKVPSTDRSGGLRIVHDRHAPSLEQASGADSRVLLKQGAENTLAHDEALAGELIGILPFGPESSARFAAHEVAGFCQRGKPQDAPAVGLFKNAAAQVVGMPTSHDQKNAPTWLEAGKQVRPEPGP